MAIDPRARALGEQLGGGVDITELDLAQVRAATDAAARQGPRPEVAGVEDLEIPGPGGSLPVRVYTPEGRGPFPVLVYFHGGGWAFCSVETHDAICRALSNSVGCLVVSADYRLAPEHRFPAAVEDAWAATRWAVEHARGLDADPERVAVGGDSSGGNLAAVVALMARDRGGPPLRHQLLIYPITNHGWDTVSYRENADGPLLTRSMMRTFWSWYLGDDSEAAEPYASPLRAESLAGLPPAFVLTAEYDPLRDEGEAYAARLAEAGVPVVQRRYPGMIHGFFAMGDELEAARQAFGDATRELRDALHPSDARGG